MRRPTGAQVRDVVLFLGGLGLLAYETLGVAHPREILLLLAAAMMGLPATLRTDRLFQAKPPPDEPSS